MNVLKEILERDLDRINKAEKRDGKPHFNSQFLKNHIWLCISMVLSYILLAALLIYSPYFGVISLVLFTVMFLVMAGILLFDIKPIYKFEDIGVLDLRVCYNGEWYTFEKLSDDAINEIYQHPAISQQIKEDIREIISKKQEIHFYDVYLMAFDPVQQSISASLLSSQA
ncbi:YlaC family protein [Proteus hauseri]|uniref:YlaC family protein n=1 Tax=Proteus cibi TaxID=2050966 RepID=A0ABU6E9Y4_9GAMM|nr:MULTISPECIES: YlaC family protein [Proteus]MBG6031891.1 YlaC family protein [Proteus hauseri]MBS6210745.1 YlaC family protein [Proteus hauseri]MEB6855886.1 YlaC family protein [Proteus cibi]MEB7088121.1 YlaC family protein [Proteus cibi]